MRLKMAQHKKNFTAKEANEMLADFEDTPENRKRWSEAAAKEKSK
jgi:hypothetical protein